MTKKKPVSQFSRNFSEPFTNSKTTHKHEPMRKLERAGYIYFINAGNGVYKIGRARKPENRLHTFKVKLPFPVEFELLIQADDMYKLERELHTRFENKLINGEWYKLDSADVDNIRAEYLGNIEQLP